MKFEKKYILIGLVLIILMGLLWWMWTMYQAKNLKPKVSKITANLQTTGVFTPNRDKLLINFDQEIPTTARTLIKIETEPNFNIESSWANSNTIILETKETLPLDTSYTIKISYNNNLVDQTEIRTPPISEQEIEALMEDQAKSEEAFFQQEKAMVAKYPWYTKLPIETVNYSIEYNPEVSKVRISIFPAKDATEQDKTEIRENAIKDMERELGIKKTDTSKYYIKMF